MARKGRVDRGLRMQKDTQGKTIWVVRLYHHGKERRFGSFPTKTKAREFYEKAKREQAEEKFHPEKYQRGGITIEELIDRHVETSTVKNRCAEKNYGQWWKGHLKGVRLIGITPEALEKAQAVLLDKKLSPQTVLHYMKFLRHILNKAVKKGTIEINPFSQITLLKVPKGRTRFLSPTEETALLDKLGPIYGPWARLAILTGMRLGEQFGLKWQWVDFDQGLITLPSTKAGDAQYVHLNREAQAILRTMQVMQMNQGILSPWVFPSEKPSSHLDQRNFYARIFVPAVKEAKLENVTWHTLRHTFASRLAMAGYSEGTIADLLRHSTTALVRRYAHLSQDHLRGAVEDVASFGKLSTTPEKQIPTVTKTVIEETEKVEKRAEVVENVGAGEGI